MDGPGRSRASRGGRGGRRGRLLLASRVASGDRRRAGAAGPCRAGRGGPGRARRSAHRGRKRGGRPVRARLRPRPGQDVADGDEPPHRRRAPLRSGRLRRPRHRPPAAGAGAPSPGEGVARAPESGVETPHRRLCRRRERLARNAQRPACARVRDPRVRAGAVERRRYRGVAEADVPRSLARVDAGPHAASPVAAPAAGPDPRLLHAVSSRQAAGRRSPAVRCRRVAGACRRGAGHGGSARSGRSRRARERSALDRRRLGRRRVFGPLHLRDALRAAARRRLLRLQ